MAAAARDARARAQLLVAPRRPAHAPPVSQAVLTAARHSPGRPAPGEDGRGAATNAHRRPQQTRGGGGGARSRRESISGGPSRCGAAGRSAQRKSPELWFRRLPARPRPAHTRSIRERSRGDPARPGRRLITAAVRADPRRTRPRRPGNTAVAAATRRCWTRTASVQVHARAGRDLLVLWPGVVRKGGSGPQAEPTQRSIGVPAAHAGGQASRRRGPASRQGRRLASSSESRRDRVTRGWNQTRAKWAMMLRGRKIFEAMRRGR